MNRTVAGISLALLLAAAPAAAQYTRPGELGEARLTAREQVLRASQNARWKLGPVELEPRLAISDLGYVSNIYFTTEGEAQSDLRATGSAGIRGFLTLGPKVLVSPFVDLSYAWWLEQTSLRSSNEGFGLQLFGDFNYLQLQLQAGSVETQRDLSSEILVPINRRNDRLEAEFSVDFRGPFELFGAFGDSRLRYRGRAAEEQIQGLVLANLDADSELLRGGIGYELSSGLRIRLGIERTQTTYINDPGLRSNRGSGPLLRIGFEGTRLGLDVQAARRDIQFEGRQNHETRRQDSGRGQFRWALGETLKATLYGGIELQASALEQSAIFESRRFGINVRRDPGKRARLGVFYEVGEDEFASVASDRVSRLDDFRSFGARLQFQLTPRLNLQVGYVDTRRESSNPAFDRDVRSLISNVSLGSDLLTW